MSDIADDLKQSVKDLVTGKSIKDTVVNKAKALLGIQGDPTPPPAPAPKADPYHDEQVRKANESFKNNTTPAPAKPLPKYKDGIDKVPETGPAILHKGEAVLKKTDADKYRKNMALEKSLGKKSSAKKSKSKSSKKKHKIKHMHIEPTDNGGFLARHMHEQPEDAEEGAVPDSTHALQSPDDLLAHVQDHFGGQLPDPNAAGAAGAAGGPPAAAAGAPPSMA